MVADKGPNGLKCPIGLNPNGPKGLKGLNPNGLKGLYRLNPFGLNPLFAPPISPIFVLCLSTTKNGCPNGAAIIR